MPFFTLFLYNYLFSFQSFYFHKIRIVLTILWMSQFWEPENHREAEQGCDNRQNVGKASFFDQPTKFFEFQRC